MRFVPVPVALEERLGESGSAALVEMLNAGHRACAESAMTQCTERFDRRLVEETSKLRLELAQLRGEMQTGFAALRQEMADGRFGLLKWAFVFWVGQLVSVVGIVALLLRTLPAK
ncbi:MAG: hypothetical protein HY047_16850 [Acidobacteria bacterium]|nr:hypothetical protein [Acidobacteriota bacterium]